MSPGGLKLSGIEFRPLTSSVQAFPARILVLVVKDLVLRKERRVVYGKTSLKVFAYYDQRSSSWRMLLPSGAEDLTAYSETWPSSGMTRSGRAYERATLGHHTTGSRVSSL